MFRHGGDSVVQPVPKYLVYKVELNEGDTWVEIYCTTKPGLLLSTFNTLDALGLDIQQGVTGCFNDFAMHASCYDVVHSPTWMCFILQLYQSVRHEYLLIGSPIRDKFHTVVWSTDAGTSSAWTALAPSRL